MKKPIVIKRNQSGLKNKNLFISSSEQRVMQVFFTYPEKEFSLTEISNLAHVKKANIGKLLDKLVKKGLITINKLNTIWRICANLRSEKYVRLKLGYNLSFIYQSDIIEFLNDYYNNPKSIILFGSYRKGEDISTSDIDIAIEQDNIKDYGAVKLKELAVFEALFNRTVQIHLFNKKNVNPNLFDNIINGIVLIGFLGIK